METPPYSRQRDPPTTTLNARAIAEWSPKLADVVEDVLDAGEFPILRGGHSSLDGLFIHVDADCLNVDVMPAVDDRIPDGLSWSEFTTTLRIAVSNGKALGSSAPTRPSALSALSLLKRNGVL